MCLRKLHHLSKQVILPEKPVQHHRIEFTLNLIVSENILIMLQSASTESSEAPKLEVPKVSCKIERPLSPSTNSPESFAQARQWIGNCVSEHEHCTAHMQPKSGYPTRLIDCGHRGEESKTVCRITETDESILEQEYVTLSHQWGTHVGLELTTDNYAALLDEIPWHLLPQLYQDAIHVAHNLGVRYLWIDSLCIIQRGDDLADWHREATHMGNIYANAVCSIAALDAPDSLSSMFCSRDPDALSPPVGKMTFKDCAVTYTISDSTLWFTEVRDAPLNGRGWVLQERLLAPRILYFGKRHLLWECGELEAADVLPDGLPERPGYRSRDRWDVGLKESFQCLRTNDSDDEHLAYQCWRKIIRAYTTCKLSYSQDKAMAISAVAKRMAVILQDEYVAGFWLHHLPEQLPWVVSNGQQPEQYRAPSWSWLALDGRLVRIGPHQPREYLETLIEVLEVRLQHTTEDKTGPISGGSLRVLCGLKQISLVAKPNIPNPGILSFYIKRRGRLNDYEEGIGIVYIDSCSTARELAASDSIFCMPVTLAYSSSIEALVLEPVDKKKGIFRRVGAIYLDKPEEAVKCLLTPNEHPEEIPCEEYKESRYRISII